MGVLSREFHDVVRSFKRAAPEQVNPIFLSVAPLDEFVTREEVRPQTKVNAI